MTAGAPVEGHLQRNALLAFGGLGLVVLAIFAATTMWQWRSVAGYADAESLDVAQAVQKHALAQRSRQSEQVARAIVDNAGFVAYVGQAVSAGATDAAAVDSRSIRDQLDERREGLGLDVMAVVQNRGQLVASAGDALPESTAFDADPRFVQASTKGTQASGIWIVGPRTYQATFTPMKRAGNVVATLLTATLDTAKGEAAIAALSHADHALLVNAPDGPKIIASSLGVEASAGLLAALRARPELMVPSPIGADPATVDSNGGSSTSSLRFTALPDPGIMLVTAIGSKARDAHRRAIVMPAVAGLLVMLAVLFVVAALLWTQWIVPLLALRRLGEHAAVGDHAIAFEPRGSETVRMIGLSFNRLLEKINRHRPAPGTPRRRATDRR